MNLIKNLPSKLIIFAKRSVNIICYPQYSLFGIEILFFLGLILYSIISALPIFNIEVIKTIFNPAVIKPIFGLEVIKSIFNLAVIKPIFNLGVITIIFNPAAIMPIFGLEVIKPIFNFEVIKLIFNLEVIKSILNIFNLCFLVIGLIVAVIKFDLQKDLNYGGVKEQLNDTEDKGRMLKTSVPKFFSRFHIYFLVLSFFLFICEGLSIGDTFINELGIFTGLILFVFELFINFLAFSPYLFILMMAVIPTIVNSIGSNTTILNWSFLLLIFVTIIGENFFEKDLVSDRFSKEISEENLILRKISNYIGVVFLYFGIILSESIVNSTYYYIFFTSQAYPIIAYLKIFVAKSLIYLLVFAVYLGTEKKIIYLIFRFYYRNEELKQPDNVAKVFLDDNKRWKVENEDSQVSHDLKEISMNTYKDRNNGALYVKNNGDIHEKLKDLNKNEGNNIIGVVNVSTIFLFLITIAIIPINYCLDRQVRVDDGIYKIVEKSNKTDNVGEIIKVSGDAIVYKGKVEALDRRTQSFEHGTISIRKKEENILTKLTKYLRGEKDREDKNSYIELTINQGEKKDKKIEKYKKIKE